MQLADSVRTEILERGFSRRQLGRIASLLAGGAATMPFYNEFAMAQNFMRAAIPPDAVRISSNENPLGPCPEALEAIYRIAKFGGRYSPNGNRVSSFAAPPKPKD